MSCDCSHGEALTFEPLLVNKEESLLKGFSVVAIATVTQVKRINFQKDQFFNFILFRVCVGFGAVYNSGAQRPYFTTIEGG